MVEENSCYPHAAGMKSPGTVSRESYTCSADEVARSSFGAMCIPSKIHGNLSIQFGPIKPCPECCLHVPPDCIPMDGAA